MPKDRLQFETCYFYCTQTVFMSLNQITVSEFEKVLKTVLSKSEEGESDVNNNSDLRS